MLEKEPKQGKKFQYLRIYNLVKIWSRIHQVFGPEFTWSRKYLVPNSPLGPEFTWSRIHLIPLRSTVHFSEHTPTTMFPSSTENTL